MTETSVICKQKKRQECNKQKSVSDCYGVVCKCNDVRVRNVKSESESENFIRSRHPEREDRRYP